MKKFIISIIAMAVCLIGLGQESQVMGAHKAKKLTDLTCVAGQTIFFDGADWVCVDFPVGAGLTGLERVQANTPLNSIATKEIDAVCPVGKMVVGGGYLFFFGGPTVPIRMNAPVLDLSAWRVSGTNTANTDWSVSAIAICADVAD